MVRDPTPRAAPTRAAAGRAAADIYRRAGTTAPPVLAAFADRRTRRDQTLRQVYLEHVGDRTTDRLDAAPRRARRRARRGPTRFAPAARPWRAPPRWCATKQAQRRAPRVRSRPSSSIAPGPRRHGCRRCWRRRAPVARSSSARAAANAAASGTIEGILRSRPGGRVDGPRAALPGQRPDLVTLRATGAPDLPRRAHAHGHRHRRELRQRGVGGGGGDGRRGRAGVGLRHRHRDRPRRRARDAVRPPVEARRARRAARSRRVRRSVRSATPATRPARTCTSRCG